MDLNAAKATMLQLCKDATVVMQTEGSEPSTFNGLSPFNDTSRNKPFEALPSFEAASQELGQLSKVEAQFGLTRTHEIVLQFIFTYLSSLEDKIFDINAFEKTWTELLKELDTDVWTYFLVSNLQNFETKDQLMDVGDGISIRSRSYDELSRLLGWSHQHIDATLGKDWHEGSGGEHVLIIETRLKKAPDNLVLAYDPAAFVKLSQALLALQLLKAGDIRPGKIFAARPAHFYFGLRWSFSSGYSIWRPGKAYTLSQAEIPDVRERYDLMIRLNASANKYIRTLNLALRSFASIYERHLHQAEDRLLDAITAVEAMLQLSPAELSFRSASRVAGLLGNNDNERVAIFDDMRGYYDTRSKVVHGSELESKHVERLQNLERLEDYVRRLLVGFIRLACDEKLTKEFYNKLDGSLLHSERREHVREAMKLVF